MGFGMLYFVLCSHEFAKILYKGLESNRALRVNAVSAISSVKYPQAVANDYGCVPIKLHL